MKFKVGDLLRRKLGSNVDYKYVCAVDECGEYEVTWSVPTPSAAIDLKRGCTMSMGTKYIEEFYVLDTEYKRVAEFNVDIKDILSEV